MIKVAFDPNNNNKITGYYLESISDDSPQPPNDNYIEINNVEHGAALNIAANHVVDGVCVYIEPELTDDDAARVVRSKRNFLLKDSDWTQMSDNVITAEKKNEWAAYRQLLRDITAQDGFPQSVSFPEAPE